MLSCCQPPPRGKSRPNPQSLQTSFSQAGNAATICPHFVAGLWWIQGRQRCDRHACLGFTTGELTLLQLTNPISWKQFRVACDSRSSLHCLYLSVMTELEKMEKMEKMTVTALTSSNMFYLGQQDFHWLYNDPNRYSEKRVNKWQEGAVQALSWENILLAHRKGCLLSCEPQHPFVWHQQMRSWVVHKSNDGANRNFHQENPKKNILQEAFRSDHLTSWMRTECHRRSQEQKSGHGGWKCTLTQLQSTHRK